MDPQTRFPKVRWGAHFSGRVQERILTMAATIECVGSYARSSGVVGVSASAIGSGTDPSQGCPGEIGPTTLVP